MWEARWGVCRDGTLFIPGLHENVSTRDDFTRDNLQSQHNVRKMRTVRGRRAVTFLFFTSSESKRIENKNVLNYRCFVLFVLTKGLRSKR